MLVTLDTSQLLISSLNVVSPSNNDVILVIWETSHELISPYVVKADSLSLIHRSIAVVKEDVASGLKIPSQSKLSST